VTQERRVRVEVFEGESIVPRGRKKVTYLVHFNDGWVLAGEHPGAAVERLSPGPGTVWEHRIELELPVGTRLCRIESVPHPEPEKDALDYLTDERRGQRRLSRRRELEVNRRGDLVDASDKPARAAPPARRPR
jgi:hypothetical protein